VTPEQEERVRRALRAAARADEPVRMPPEVADRLDEVLADLAGTEQQVAATAEHVGATEDEVAARRGRRWPRGLVAAAGVAIIAVAGAAVATDGFGLGGTPDSHSAGTAASSKAESASPSTSPPTSQHSPSTGGVRSLKSDGARRDGVPVLHSSTLAADVLAVLRAEHASITGRAPRASDEAPVGCARPFTGRGASLFVVRLDGRPATLVVSPARGGRREARVYSCAGAGNRLASVSVPPR
jgi:hypothetical protein